MLRLGTVIKFNQHAIGKLEGKGLEADKGYTVIGHYNAECGDGKWYYTLCDFSNDKEQEIIVSVKAVNDHICDLNILIAFTPTSTNEYSEAIVQDYLKKEGVRCPMCQSDNIEGGQMNIECNVATQEVKCHNCGEEWTDLYTLTNIVPR